MRWNVGPAVARSRMKIDGPKETGNRGEFTAPSCHRLSGEPASHRHRSRVHDRCPSAARAPWPPSVLHGRRRRRRRALPCPLADTWGGFLGWAAPSR